MGQDDVRYRLSEVSPEEAEAIVALYRVKPCGFVQRRFNVGRNVVKRLARKAGLNKINERNNE